MASWHKHSTKRKGSYTIPHVKLDGTIVQRVVTFVEVAKPIKLPGKGY